MGKLGEATIFASETVALDVIGASFVREVDPGEVILVNDSGLRSFRPFAKAEPRPCVFEHVYFSRPDSIAEGQSVYEVRKAIGAELAFEAPVDADYVVPVPDSGVPAAIGFSQASGIPFELGIIRSHYVGRTFIQPTQDVRHLGVKLKHNANSALVDGKSIVLIDDSIVRGTTSVKLVQMMRDAGAREVHMLVAFRRLGEPRIVEVERNDLRIEPQVIEPIEEVVGAKAPDTPAAPDHLALPELKRDFAGDDHVRLRDPGDERTSERLGAEADRGVEADVTEHCAEGPHRGPSPVLSKPLRAPRHFEAENQGDPDPGVEDEQGVAVEPAVRDGVE